jgi:hypothetical protein
MAEAKALRTMATPKVRKLLFEDWWREHVTPAAGVLIPQRELFKAYCGRVDKRNRLGEQGFEAALNGLRVKRVVKQGKTYREGVTFTTRPVEAVELDGVTTADQARRQGRLQAGVPVEADWGGVSPRGAEDGGVPGMSLRAIYVRSDERDPEFPSISVAFELCSERLRQMKPGAEGGEGFDADHDDASDPGAHERAAACYAYAAGQADHLGAFVDFNAKTAPREGRLGWVVRDTLVMMWPWSVLWWKPKTDAPDWKRRCLVRAGALIIAAIERIDRAKARASLEASQAKDMTGV